MTVFVDGRWSGVNHHKLARCLKWIIQYGIEHAITGHDGYWFCYDCEKQTEREEGEQGQAAHCAFCRSHCIRFIEPSNQKQKAAPSAPPDSI